MATKKLIIEAEVKTDQLDKAVKKLGELKDLGKGLKIQYDIDGKPLDVVIDKSKNLQQQVKILTAELRKTKEGTDEFTLLSAKLNNTKDDLTRVNTKSRELFATFSLIPGPIGEIFGKLNGLIGLLKTFSGFSIKDIGNQFKNLFGDIKNITDSFYGLNSAQKQNIEIIDESTLATDASTAANIKDNDLRSKKSEVLSESTVATDAATAAQLKQNNVTKDNNDLQFEYLSSASRRRGVDIDAIALAAKTNESAANAIKLQDDLASKFEMTARAVNITGSGFKQYTYELTDANGKLITLTESQAQAAVETGVLDDATKQSTNTTKGATASYGIMGTALKTLGFNALAASAAVVVLDTVLAAIGIGIIIAAVVGLISVITDLTSQFYNWASGATAAKKAMDEVNKTIDKTNELLDLDLKGSKRRNDEYIALLKSRGATEKEVNKATMDGLKERLTLTETALDDISKAQNKALSEGRATSEEYKKIEADRTKLEQQTKDLRSEIRVKELDGITQNNKKILEAKQKAIDEGKRLREKEIADDKIAMDLLLKLQQENSVNKLNDERKKQDAQLKIDKQNEEREINNLKLSKGKEELRAKLLEQVRIKYGIKVIELNKKRQEEDNKSFDESQKKIKEYNDKVFEIMNAADESEIGRNKATRQRKYADDVAALQKDTEFQKQSTEEKIRILLLLEKGLKQDLQKLDDDEAQKGRDKNLKRLTDELNFLQIRGDALREGTKSFFDNQRAILKAAEKKELADLEDRGIKEKLTIEQIEAEKLNIKKKYLKASKDIANQELQAILQAAQATLGVAQTIAQDIGKVAQIEQQVAMEEATKRYIKQNELDKKTITNQEKLDAKLIENKKKFAQEEDDIKRKAFEENKKIQIAQAIIATLQSAVGAFSSLIAIPIVGPVLAPVAAAAALVFGYKQVAAIKKTQYQSSLELSASESSGGTGGGASCKPNYGKNYADGGLIGGKRHAQGGTMIEAEQGEAIMTRGAVTQFAPLLSLMNQAGGGTSFNSNLMTTRQDNPILSNPAQEQAPLIVKTYVVSQELTTEAHRQARLKNLSTI